MFESFLSGFEYYGLIGLFLCCFLSATILPLSSELIFLLFLNSSPYDVWLILAVASLGNCLGGVTNYFLGYYGSRLFAVKKEGKAFLFAQKYGVYSAFFSWLPFVGDPLLIALGFLNSKPFGASFWPVIFFMCLGKCLRYLALMYF